jgi:hypothetical protein
MADMNVAGVRAGEEFWYTPLGTLSVPRLHAGCPIVRIDGDYRFVESDGSHIYSSEVHKTEDDARDFTISWCKRRIAKSQEEIAEAQIVLAKMMVLDDTPVPVVNEDAVTDDIPIPF